MTAYVAVGTGTSGAEVSITPVSNEIRIAQVVFSGIDSLDNNPFFGGGTVSWYSSGVSGGTAISIAPMRQGASAATSTAKTGGITGSGTQHQVFSQTGSGASTSFSNGTSTFFNSSFSLTFTPPFDFIISPGAALLAVGNIGSPSTAANEVFVFFEELRLSWPY